MAHASKAIVSLSLLRLFLTSEASAVELDLGSCLQLQVASQSSAAGKPLSDVVADVQGTLQNVSASSVSDKASAAESGGLPLVEDVLGVAAALTNASARHGSAATAPAESVGGPLEETLADVAQALANARIEDISAGVNSDVSGNVSAPASMQNAFGEQFLKPAESPTAAPAGTPVADAMSNVERFLANLSAESDATASVESLAGPIAEAAAAVHSALANLTGAETLDESEKSGVENMPSTSQAVADVHSIESADDVGDTSESSSFEAERAVPLGTPYGTDASNLGDTDADSVLAHQAPTTTVAATTASPSDALASITYGLNGSAARAKSNLTKAVAAARLELTNITQTVAAMALAPLNGSVADVLAAAAPQYARAISASDSVSSLALGEGILVESVRAQFQKILLDYATLSRDQGLVQKSARMTQVQRRKLISTTVYLKKAKEAESALASVTVDARQKRQMLCNKSESAMTQFTDISEKLRLAEEQYRRLTRFGTEAKISQRLDAAVDTQQKMRSAIDDANHALETAVAGMEDKSSRLGGAVRKLDDLDSQLNQARTVADKDNLTSKVHDQAMVVADASNLFAASEGKFEQKSLRRRNASEAFNSSTISERQADQEYVKLHAAIANVLRLKMALGAAVQSKEIESEMAKRACLQASRSWGDANESAPRLHVTVQTAERAQAAAAREYVLLEAHAAGLERNAQMHLADLQADIKGLSKLVSQLQAVRLVEGACDGATDENCRAILEAAFANTQAPSRSLDWTLDITLPGMAFLLLLIVFVPFLLLYATSSGA